MTRRRRRIVFAVGAGAVSLGLVGFVVGPIASGRTSPPEYSRRTAERALDDARSSGADRWAKPALEHAEELMREAWTELRRQDVRLVFRRDYRSAREKLRAAEAAATWARESADRSREEAGTSADQELARARRMLEATAGLLDECRFGPAPASLVRRARIHADEAESYRTRQEYGLARLRAEQALLELAQARNQMRGAVGRFVDPSNVQLWRDWSRETVAWSKRTGQAAIVVNKDEASLTLYVGGRPVRRYDAEIGRNHMQAKLRAGDAATPEGRYNVVSKKRRGQSKYHAALELDYPNAEDLSRFRRSRANGELRPGDRPGALIEIHGDGGRGWDWTDGCVAVRNEDMEQLVDRVPLGARVTIIGSDGDGGRFSSAARKLADGDDDR